MKSILTLLIIALAMIACSEVTDQEVTPQNEFNPLSDPQNTGNWEMNAMVSDEFNASELDESKWHIQGKNGTWESNHTGRAPSQFSTENIRVENGILNLETRWEPDYHFEPALDRRGDKFENITTAAIIGKNLFRYGYIEVRAKAADAEISSTFWATGGNTELDFFEMFGKHNQPQKLAKERELWWSIHDWTKEGGGGSTYTETHDLGFRVADDFHVYGFDWSKDGFKIYVDGELFTQANEEEINNWDDSKHHSGGNGDLTNYVATKSVKLWLSQATFPWHGVPDSKEEVGGNGVVDYKVDYVRVWQKK